MNKDKVYTVIGIIGLLSIVSFVIYIIGSFIYFGVKTAYDNYNRTTGYINSCDDANMLEPDNDYTPPVKGIVYRDSLDSLIFSNHTDLSNIDGDNLPSIDGDNLSSRDNNDDLFYYGSNGVPRIDTNRDINPRVNNYASYNNEVEVEVEVEVKLPTEITIKPSMVQIFNDRISYDVTYSY